ncbi:hypothetical protein [Methylobacterium sp. AMS5]|uniref:hypothetical protein n=1 Tax=Methylobacterium sp. AMS5 TaxID=925818 RepID=UPI000A42C174|nr:hypothetical protein [Methylobacterium sp. AMS5]
MRNGWSTLLTAALVIQCAGATLMLTSREAFPATVSVRAPTISVRAPSIARPAVPARPATTTSRSTSSSPVTGALVGAAAGAAAGAVQKGWMPTGDATDAEGVSVEGYTVD